MSPVTSQFLLTAIILVIHLLRSDEFPDALIHTRRAKKLSA